MKHEYVECACGCGEHLLRFTWESDPNWPEVFVDVRLDHNYSFFKRLWAGIKYIFGHKSRYGQFDEVILDNEQVKQLRDFCNEWLEEHPWPYGEKASPEDELKWAKRTLEWQKKNLEEAEKKLADAEAAIKEEI